MKMLLSFYLLCMNYELLIIGVQVDHGNIKYVYDQCGASRFDFEFEKKLWGEGEREFPGPPPPDLFYLASEHLRVCCKVVKMLCE